MGGFATEAYARKGWFSRLMTYVGSGKYGVGADSGVILVQDRRVRARPRSSPAKHLSLTTACFEFLACFDAHRPVSSRRKTWPATSAWASVSSTTTASLPRVRASRRLHAPAAFARAPDQPPRDDKYTGVQLKRVQQLFESLSVKQGKKYDDPHSARSIIPFINFHKLDVSEIAEPLNSFKTFNQFFYRKLKPGARTPASPDPVRAPSFARAGLAWAGLGWADVHGNGVLLHAERVHLAGGLPVHGLPDRQQGHRAVVRAAGSPRLACVSLNANAAGRCAR